MTKSDQQPLSPEEKKALVRDLFLCVTAVVFGLPLSSILQENVLVACIPFSVGIVGLLLALPIAFVLLQEKLTH